MFNTIFCLKQFLRIWLFAAMPSEECRCTVVAFNTYVDLVDQLSPGGACGFSAASCWYLKARYSETVMGSSGGLQSRQVGRHSICMFTQLSTLQAIQQHHSCAKSGWHTCLCPMQKWQPNHRTLDQAASLQMFAWMRALSHLCIKTGAHKKGA